MSFMRSFLILALLCLSACVSEPLPDGFQDRDDFDPVAAAKTRISLGLTYLKNGNYSQAKYNLDKALQFAPRLADAHFSMAYYFQQVDEIKLAEGAYQKALDLEPNNPNIANSYGAFLCENGDYVKAKRFFLKAVNSVNYISTAETFENLALCSQSQGQTEDAITYLQSALNHQPSRAKSLLLLVQLQAQQGQWQKAKENLRRYEKIARVTPETLGLSIRIEKALNNLDLAKGYGDMLIRMYPSHPNTLEYIRNRDSYTTDYVNSQKKPKAKTSQPEPDKPVRVLLPDSEKVADTPAMKKAVETVTQTSETENQSVTQSEDPVTDSSQPDVVRAEQGDPEAQPTSEPESPSSPQNTGDEIEAVTHHTVEKGENLYRISLLYNVKMQRLIDWNQLEDSSSIYVGKKLIVVNPQTLESL